MTYPSFLQQNKSILERGCKMAYPPLLQQNKTLSGREGLK
jgi:hypothetical protein